MAGLSQWHKSVLLMTNRNLLVIKELGGSISISKSNGLWNFMDDVDNLIIPEDLQNELLGKKEALEFFNSINPSSKRFVLRWVKLAKTEKTRKTK